MFYGKNYNIRALLEAGVHYGHRKNYWNPKMSEYIYGVKNNIHIIDLQQTVNCLEQALGALKEIAAQNGRILFIATKKQAAEAIATNAVKCGQYYVNHRWLGGMLTNWSTVSDSINTLKKYEATLNDEKSGLNKKERLVLSRKYDKLNAVLGGIRNIGGIPDALFVIGTRENAGAIKEANKLGIPIIAIVDTNCNPDNINYVVPGNDDARKAIELYCNLAGEAVLLGIQESMRRSGADLGAAEELSIDIGNNEQKQSEENSENTLENEAKNEQISV